MRIPKELTTTGQETPERNVGCEGIPPVFCKRVRKRLARKELLKCSFFKSAEGRENAGLDFSQKSERVRVSQEGGPAAETLSSAGERKRLTRLGDQGRQEHDLRETCEMVASKYRMVK